MAKRKEWEEARRLRSQGLTLDQIAFRLKVSKSSVSVWARDISIPERYVKPKLVKMPKIDKMETIDWNEVQSTMMKYEALVNALSALGYLIGGLVGLL